MTSKFTVRRGVVHSGLTSVALLVLETKGDRYYGALPKLQKVTISFLVSVCPSVRMEQLGSRWRNFNGIS